MKNLFTLILIDSAIWLVWSFLIGFSVTKLSDERLIRTWIVKTRPNAAKNIRGVFKIHLWKDKVPELGEFFKSGKSKRQLNSTDIVGLQSFRIETIRAEIAHYLFMIILPVFFFFNPLVLIIAMVFYAIFANVPFILIQRYNRSRIDEIIKNKVK